MSSYKMELCSRWWDYQKNFFPERQEYFEEPEEGSKNPPVFLKHMAHFNIIVDPHADKKNEVINIIPEKKRHPRFRSMRSSQALAQSVFGNLKVSGQLHCLSQLCDETGKPLFGDAKLETERLIMEHSEKNLGEPSPTETDVFFSGNYQVAVECKLTEKGFGRCSRPELDKEAHNYETAYCNGTYSHQQGRRKRCSLSEIGVLYWEFVPELFKWRSDSDLNPCPLDFNYQLVRNLISSCLLPNGDLSPKNGHVILIYDNRNPAFQPSGNGFVSYAETREALRNPIF